MNLFAAIERRLVADWRQGMRWRSVHWSVAGVGFNVLAAAVLKGVTVAVAFLGFVPLPMIPLIAAGLSALALAGRFTRQEPETDDSDDNAEHA